MIPKGLAESVTVTTNNPALYLNSYVNFKTRVRGIATKMPGFAFTGYQTFASFTVLTSHQDYVTIRDKVWNMTEAISASSEVPINDYIATVPNGSTYGVPKQGFVLRYEKNSFR